MALFNYQPINPFLFLFLSLSNIIIQIVWFDTNVRLALMLFKFFFLTKASVVAVDQIYVGTKRL